MLHRVRDGAPLTVDRRSTAAHKGHTKPTTITLKDHCITMRYRTVRAGRKIVYQRPTNATAAPPAGHMLRRQQCRGPAPKTFCINTGVTLLSSSTVPASSHPAPSTSTTPPSQTQIFPSPSTWLVPSRRRVNQRVERPRANSSPPRRRASPRRSPAESRSPIATGLVSSHVFSPSCSRASRKCIPHRRSTFQMKSITPFKSNGERPTRSPTAYELASRAKGANKPE